MAPSEKRGPNERRKLFADIVLGELRSAHQPLTGLQLRDRLADAGHPVRPSQVYRTLAQLKEAGAVLHIRSTSSYIAHPATSKIILICETCGDHMLAQAGDTPDQCELLARRCGFQPDQLVLEVIGLCRRCDQPGRAAQ